jgi:hypothetical protein
MHINLLVERKHNGASQDATSQNSTTHNNTLQNGTSHNGTPQNGTILKMVRGVKWHVTER